MYGVYILKSKKDGSLYKGFSSDVKKRIIEHNKGKVSATTEKRPLELIYCELFKNKKDATQREIYLKTGWGRNFLKKVLKNALKE